MKALHVIGWILVVVGGLNWGLIGLSYLIGGGNWNVVNLILGAWPQAEALVYILVGLAAVWSLIKHRGECKECMM